MFGSFILMFITILSIAILNEMASIYNWQEGLHLGVLTGPGIAFLSMAVNMLYGKKPLGLYL